MQVLFMLSHIFLCVVTVPISFPGLLLNAPIMYICNKLALKAQVKALAVSKVKVGAYDVVMSERLKTAGALVPIFYIVYSVVVAVFASILFEEQSDDIQFLEWAIPLAVFLFLPTFSYVSIRLSDVWYFSSKKAKALWKRNSKDVAMMQDRRDKLQKKVRQFVDAYISEKTFAGDYERPSSSDRSWSSKLMGGSKEMLPAMTEEAEDVELSVSENEKLSVREAAGGVGGNKAKIYPDEQAAVHTTVADPPEEGEQKQEV